MTVIYIYTLYSKASEKTTITPDEFEKFKKDIIFQIQGLNERILTLDEQLNKKVLFIVKITK